MPRWLRLGTFAVAVVGVLLCVGLVPRLLGLLRTDPFSDVAAYYQAAQRLNSGQPLYGAGIDVNASEFYRYPPLLAIAFQPLTAFPYEVVAAGWGILMAGSLAATIAVLGTRRRATWILMATLAFPIAWSLAIGQAQVLVTLLLAIARPWSVALAGQLKVLPALAAIYWVARREWGALGRFALWSGGLMALQAILQPEATLDFFRVTNLEQVGNIDNLSPYGISPVLWGVLAAAGLVLAFAAGRTRFGWAIAVSCSVLVTPRLLWYLLMALLAAIGRPGEPAAAAPASDRRVSDLAETGPR